MKQFKFMKAFTLAEMMITMTILGIIAAMIVPNAIYRQSERNNKARLQKALTTYQKAIESMIVENDLTRSTAALDNWGNNDENCSHARTYFRSIEEGDGDNGQGSRCVFKSPDGLWWDIGNGFGYSLSKSRVAFDKDVLLSAQGAENKDFTLKENKAFVITTSFDENGGIRINDVTYQKQQNNKTYVSYATKISCYLGLMDVNDEECEAFAKQKKDGKGEWTATCQWGDCPTESLSCNDSKNRQYNYHRYGWQYDYVCGDSVEKKCLKNDNTGSETCGYCSTNGGKLACRYGGYYCAQIGTNHFECSINGGQVSDIEYDDEGNVTWRRCNSWNEPCTNSQKLNVSDKCWTALCSYNEATGKWETGGSTTDQYYTEDFVIRWLMQTGKENDHWNRDNL